MISIRLKIILILGIIVYFVIILLFLKQRAIALKYTLLWLLAGMVLSIMVIRPSLLNRFVLFLGISDNMNGLYVTSISFVVMIIMSLTSIVSKQTEKIKSLTQSIAKMEKRIRELEKNEE